MDTESEYTPIQMIVARLEDQMTLCYREIGRWLMEKCGSLDRPDYFQAQRREQLREFAEKGWKELSTDEEEEIRQAIREVRQIIDRFFLDWLGAMENHFGMLSPGESRIAKEAGKESRFEIQRFLEDLDKDLKEGES